MPASIKGPSGARAELSCERSAGQMDQDADVEQQRKGHVAQLDQHAIEQAGPQGRTVTAAPSQLQVAASTPVLQPISTPPGKCPSRRQQSRPRTTQAVLEEKVERKLQQLQLLEQQNQQLRTRCHVLEELVQCGTEISRHLREHGCSDSSMTRQHSAYCKELELLLDGRPADTRPSPTQRRPMFEGHSVDVAAMKTASAHELCGQWLNLVKEAALDLQHLDKPDMQQRLEEHAHALLQTAVLALIWNPAAAWHISGTNLLTGETASIPPGHAELVILSTQWDPQVVSCIIPNNALQTEHQAKLEQETAQLSARMAAATAARDCAAEGDVALQLRALMSRKSVVLAVHAAAAGRLMPPTHYAHICVQSIPFSPVALSPARTMECLLDAKQLHLTNAAAGTSIM